MSSTNFDQNVSMTRKCHNHTPQTKQQHREKEAKNDNSHMNQEDKKSKATDCFFPSEMIAKLERFYSTA